jgi:hypothetical protein
MDTTAMLSANKGVKLHDASHWDVWILTLRQYASREHVWTLIDPDTPDHLRPATLDKPELPEDFYNMSRTDQKHEMEVRRMLYTDWESQNRALGNVENFIQTSVEAHVSRILLKQDTLPQRIEYLKGRFSDDQVNQRSLQDKWFVSFGTRPPKPGIDLVKWSLEWERLRDKVEAEGDFPVIPNIIFMLAIRPIKFDFWKVWVYRMDREHAKINNQDLLNEFRKEVESDPQYKKTSQALKASFSTLHGQPEASNNNNKNNTQGNTD